MTATDAPGRLRDKKEAAQYLGLSTRSLDRLVKAGLVTCVRPTPSSVKFTLADLDAFIERLRLKPQREGLET